MKIACVIHSLDGGGAERVMAGLASRLATRNHDVRLITLDDGGRNRHSLDERVRRVPLDVLTTDRRNVSLRARLSKLRLAITGEENDVVLSFCDSTNLLVMLATRFMRRRVPIVLSERSDPARQSLGVFREMLRTRLYGRAAKVVCLSDEVAVTLRSRMNVEPVVIHSAVQPPPPEYWEIRKAALASRPTAADRPIRLIAIGRLEPEKGFDRLLGVVSALNRSGTLPPWRLKLLGDGGEMDSLKTIARENGIESQIEFCGWVDSVWPHLAESDVFVLSSHYEGFPSAMLEAMAGGVAGVCVDAGGGVRAAVSHGENAWMVENAWQPLLEGIQTVCQDSELRTRIAAAAPEVGTRFGWDAMVDAYEQVLRQASRAYPQRSASVTQ